MPEEKRPRRAEKPKEQQWPDCSDKQRAKVPDINLALRDLVNPCSVARKFNVPLSRLRAFQVRDSAAPGSRMVNDFAVSRNSMTPQLVAKRKRSEPPK